MSRPRTSPLAGSPPGYVAVASGSPVPRTGHTSWRYARWADLTFNTVGFSFPKASVLLEEGPLKCFHPCGWRQHPYDP
jgi:hypothetical protein